MQSPHSQEHALCIGLSARIMHNSPLELGFHGKSLQYLESSIAHWIMTHGALAMMIPVLDAQASSTKVAPVSAYVDHIDGLVLQGGADIAPQSYGQEPINPAWAGDMVRDRYELALLRECLRQHKPVLGVCRGAQLLNVCFGGNLCQDIVTLRPNSQPHVEPSLYDEHQHGVAFAEDSLLSRLYRGERQAIVTSLHHQAVDRLGDDIVVEALSTDGVVEAIRWTGDEFVLGLQWHPEFHMIRPGLLDSAPVMQELLRVAAKRAGMIYPRPMHET